MKKRLSFLTLTLIFSSVIISQPIQLLTNHASKYLESIETTIFANPSGTSTIASYTTYGNEAVFNSDHTLSISVSVLDSNRFVVAYRDGADGYGKVIIGTLSGSTITYGSEHVFNSGSTTKPMVACIDSNRFVVAYGDYMTFFLDKELVIAGSVTGDNVSFGTPVIYDTIQGRNENPVMALDTNSFIIAYADLYPTRYGKAIIGMLTGLNISLSEPSLFCDNFYNPGYPTRELSLTNLDSTNFALAYSTYGDTCSTVAKIGTVVGNNITFGDEYEFSMGVSAYHSITALDTDKFVVAYSDTENSQHGTAVVGNVNGNTITYGQEFEFFGGTIYVSASALDTNHFVVVYFNNEYVHSGASKIGTVVQNMIYFDDEITYNPGYSFNETVKSFNENRYVIAYGDEDCGASPDHIGTSIIGTISQFPIITKINADTICPENSIKPIITQYIEDVVEISISLYYDTLLHNYVGYQNHNSLLDSGTLDVTDNNGQIDIIWHSSTSIYIPSDTLLELILENTESDTQYTSDLVWDTNSYYKNSQDILLETVLHDGQIVIDPIPSYAGAITGDSIVCQGTGDLSYQINQIVNATSYTWELVPDTAGTIIGTDTIITINYSPSYAGIATLSVCGSNLCGDGASSSLNIEVIESPAVNAGPDDEICESESVQLSGEASGYSGIYWQTSGDGMFDDSTVLTATYYPGSVDIVNGIVDLTLTATPNYPCTENNFDQTTVVIVSMPDQPQLPEGPTVIDLDITQTSEYSTSRVNNATGYGWFIYPLEAGSIIGNDTIGIAQWEPSYTGIFAYVYVNAINDCGDTGSDSLLISLSPVVIRENMISKNIVYPNPAKDYFSIKLDSKEINEISIYNSLQQRVIKNTNYIGKVDISKLKPGIYYIEIISDDNKYRQVIIKK